MYSRSVPRKVAFARNPSNIWDSYCTKGYSPLPSHVNAISCINPPENLKELRTFLGVINFIKNHIPRHAEICKPIARLTRKDIPFSWAEAQQSVHLTSSNIGWSIFLQTWAKTTHFLISMTFSTQKENVRGTHDNSRYNIKIHWQECIPGQCQEKLLLPGIRRIFGIPTAPRDIHHSLHM